MRSLRGLRKQTVAILSQPLAALPPYGCGHIACRCKSSAFVLDFHKIGTFYMRFPRRASPSDRRAGTFATAAGGGGKGAKRSSSGRNLQPSQARRTNFGHRNRNTPSVWRRDEGIAPYGCVIGMTQGFFDTLKPPRRKTRGFVLEVPPRFELGTQGFADPCLTTWPRHRVL